VLTHLREQLGRGRKLSRPRNPSRRPQVETLENRLVPAVIIPPVLTLTGNAIQLSRTGANLHVVADGVASDVPFAALTAIQVNGNNNGDTLTVDFSGGPVVPSGGLNYVAGTGSNNVLNLQGGTFNDEVYTPFSAGGGTILLGGTQLITYSNLTPVYDTNLAGSYIVNGTNGNDTINMTAGPTIGGVATVQINDGGNPLAKFERVNIALKNNITVNGFFGNNVFNVDFSNGNPIPSGGLNYNGGGGLDQVFLTGGSSTLGDVYWPGLSPGNGVVSIPAADGTPRLLHFSNVNEPLLDTNIGPLTVVGTPADNAINVSDVPDGTQLTLPGGNLTYSGMNNNLPAAASVLAGNLTAKQVVAASAIIITPPTFGLVTVDNFVPIVFTNKNYLNLAGGPGIDTIHINDPRTPTGLVGINVDGNDPTSGDRLIVNSASASVPVHVTVNTSIITGATGANGGVPIHYANIEGLTVNMGGQSGLIISGSNDYTYLPAAAPDAGTVIVTYAMPQLIADPTLAIDFTGLYTGSQLTLVGGGNGTVVVNGTDADDSFSVTATPSAPGAVTLMTGGVTPSIRTTIQPQGISVLTLNGLGGADSFSVSSGEPYQLINLAGGGGPAGVDIATLTGNGTALAASLYAEGNLSVTGGGITQTTSGQVYMSGIETVNLNSNGGALTVKTMANLSFPPLSTDDTVTITPLSSSGGRLQLAGAAPVVNYSTNGSTGTGAFNIDLGAGNNTLIVNGTQGDDTFAVTGLLVGVAGRLPINYAHVQSLMVNGLSGDDSFLVFPSTAVSYNVDGGDSTGTSPGDQLNVNTSNAVTFNSGPTSDSGSIVASGSKPITFSHVEALATSSNVPVTINRTVANEFIDVTETGRHATKVTVSSGTQFTLNNTATLTLKALGLGDNVNVTASLDLAPGWNENLTIDGGSFAGNGNVFVQTPGGNITTYNAASSSLSLNDGSSITLTRVKQLTYDGGGTGGSLWVVGTAGNDTITLTPAATDAAAVVAVNRLLPIAYQDLGGDGLTTGLVTIDGHGGTDTLLVNGTAGDDTFQVAPQSGTPGNTLVTLNSRPPVIVHAIATVKLDGGPGLNTLIGPDLASNWNITATNSGNLASATAGALGSAINFVHVQNLIGGAGNDNFIFANGKGVTGSIDGGSGTNALSYAAYTTGVRVNLQLGTATAVAGGVSNIQNVTGGKGNDILVGDDQNNVLNAGSGYDILIGGRGSDTLNSSATGNAVLIAGFTDYDTNTTALLSLLAEWSRNLPYASRIANLRAGGGLNGNYKLVLGSTVLNNDGVVDTLNGSGTAGTATNWYWAMKQGNQLIDIINNQRLPLGTEQVD
jgi:hypothetical protein